MNIKRHAVTFSVVVAVVVLFWWFSGLLGFNPTDDGYILSQSWRLLQGQTPHIDFTSPRPTGSAILHLPEVLIPWGTIALSRLVVSFQYALIAWVSVLLFKKGQVGFSATQDIALFVIAFILNVGIWPLMSWHTVDGIFMVFIAVWIALSKRYSFRAALMVWLFVGCAPLMKQGFIVSPLVLILVLANLKKLEFLKFIWVAVVPGVLYLLWTTGPDFAVENQLRGGAISELLKPIKLAIDYVLTPWGVLSVALSCSVLLLLLTKYSKSNYVKFFIAFFAIAPAAVLGWKEHFALDGTYTYQIYIVFIMATFVTILLHRAWLFYLSIVILAYGVSMSWGVVSPGLLSGTMTLGILALIISHGIPPKENLPRSYSPILLALACVMSLVLMNNRVEFAYRDPQSLGFEEQSKIPAFALIKMGSQPKLFIDNLQSCLDQFPATNVTIFPDGAVFYPAFRIHNEFHTDWFLPVERSADYSARIQSDIQNLHSKGNFLLLFESFPLSQISSMDSEMVVSPGAPFFHGDDDSNILQGFPDAITVNCGSLSGLYSPQNH